MIELSKTVCQLPLTVWLLDAPMNAGTLVTGTHTIENILSVVERLPKTGTETNGDRGIHECRIVDGHCAVDEYQLEENRVGLRVENLT